MLITLGTKKGLGMEPGKRMTLIISSLWLPPSFLAALLLAPRARSRSIRDLSLLRRERLRVRDLT